VIVPQAQIDLILSRRIRQRTLHLPIRSGKFGERKRCPARPGGVYRLKARVPWERYKAQAQAQPSAARAVLWLIDECERPTRSVTITVTAVEAAGGTWAVHFVKGEHRDVVDRPIYLAKYGDYTMSASQQAVRGDPELMMPFHEDLANARKKALERRISPQQAQLRRAASEAETLQQSITNMKARILIKRAQRNYEAAERLLLADRDVDSPVSAAVDGSPGEADRPPCSAAVATPEAA
jgi:hypothetical protein